MKNLFLLLLFMGVLFVSCKDNDSDRPDTNPVMTGIKPEKPIPGDEITIIGRNFKTPNSTIEFWLKNDKTLPLSVTDTTIIFIMPHNILLNDNPSGKRTVSISIKQNTKTGNNIISTPLFTKTITLAEPKGWFYQRSGNIDILTATSDSIVWGVVGASTLNIYKSSDGGNSWTAIRCPGLGTHYGYFVDDKTAWIPNFSVTNYTSIVYTTDGINPIQADTPMIPELEAMGVGVWAQNYNTGLLMTWCGLVGFSNGFSKEHCTVLYQNKDIVLRHLSAISMDEYIMFGHVKNKSSQTRLVHKKGNSMIPIEYDVSEYITSTSLQLMSDGTVYILDATGTLCHLTWPFKLTSLNQKAHEFHFVNNATGYAVFRNVIHKTTDGGKTWNKEFTVEAPYRYPDAITEYNGHVWVMMRDGASENPEYMLVKYNP